MDCSRVMKPSTQIVVFDCTLTRSMSRTSCTGHVSETTVIRHITPWRTTQKRASDEGEHHSCYAGLHSSHGVSGV